MNQKNYKEIAKIIKLAKEELDNGNIRTTEEVIEAIESWLIDYFERESKPTKYKYGDGKTIKEFDSFTREQFLKDYGLNETIRKRN